MSAKILKCQSFFTFAEDSYIQALDDEVNTWIRQHPGIEIERIADTLAMGNFPGGGSCLKLLRRIDYFF